MTLLLEQLGDKLAEKWLALLVLPGLLFVAVATIAGLLGQSHWSDVDTVVRKADQLSATLAERGPAAGVIAAVAVLLLAAACGLAATGVAHLVRRWWMGEWPWPARPLARVLTASRSRRWERLADRIDRVVAEARKAREDPDPARLAALARRRNEICLAPPQSPTWMGDRMAAMASRVRVDYGLDVGIAWPRLWLVLPDVARTETRAAAEQFTQATTLAGWGVLYLAVGAVWWPAAVIGAGVLLTGSLQGGCDHARRADRVRGGSVCGKPRPGAGGVHSGRSARPGHRRAARRADAQGRVRRRLCPTVIAALRADGEAKGVAALRICGSRTPGPDRRLRAR